MVTNFWTSAHFCNRSNSNIPVATTNQQKHYTKKQNAYNKYKPMRRRILLPVLNFFGHSLCLLLLRTILFFSSVVCSFVHLFVCSFFRLFNFLAFLCIFQSSFVGSLRVSWWWWWLVQRIKTSNNIFEKKN